MRAINLLPPRYQPARASGARTGIAYIATAVLAVLLLMVVAYVLTNNGIKDAEKKTAEAQAEQQAAQAKVGQLQAFGDFATLKASREAAVEGVAQGRFDYERLMREVALLLPHNTYLTQFSSQPATAASDVTASTGAAVTTGPTVSVTGCAPNHPAVATAIVRLRKLHNVQDVDLKSSDTSSSEGTSPAGGVCKTTWNATLTFSAESGPTTSRSVPARLGGGR